ncbi:MAG: 6,7-dimethyl-8-ribityllumazine synthase [Planctomycetota bacterium]
MALDPKTSERSVPARPGVRVGAVVSRFHFELTGAMLASARAALEAHGMAPQDLVVVEAPGAFELPIIARRLARRPDIDAVLCFGLVLTGETKHDHWVSLGATQGILSASMETDKPILFGVLTCQTLEQARARALPVSAGGQQDKGREVAHALLETLAALELASHVPKPAGFGFTIPSPPKDGAR